MWIQKISVTISLPFPWHHSNLRPLLFHVNDPNTEKTTKCEKKDLSRNLLNLSKTSWDRILALNLTQFDPLTLWESTKILFQSLSARNYADSKTWEILIWTILIKRMIPFPNYRRSFVWKSAEDSIFRFVSGVTQLSVEFQT